jgi:hypothetical protein
MRITTKVGRNNQRALRRMEWCNARWLLHPTGLNEELEVLNAQARELEQTIAQNVAEILS